MERVFRWTLRLLTLVLVLAAGAATLTYFFASRSLPDYDATWELDGLDAPVEIVRDNANVPHVFGENDLLTMCDLDMRARCHHELLRLRVLCGFIGA